MRLSTADCFGFTILRARRLTTCSNKWQLVIFCSLTTIITILINSPMSMCRHLICGQGMVVLSIRSESRKSHTFNADNNQLITQRIYALTRVVDGRTYS